MTLQDLRKINEGNTAEIFAYGEDKIIKLFRPEFPREVANWEYTVSQSIVPYIRTMPRVYELLEVEGRIGIVYERVHGNSMLQQMMRHPFSIPSFARTMARLQQEFAVPAPEELQTVQEKLKRDIERVKDLSESDKESVYQYLQRMPRGNHICHFDFHPGNIVMDQLNVYVIDWMTACQGDPNADAARTLMMLEYAGVGESSFLKRNLFYWVKKSLIRHYLKEYRRLTHASMDDINQWKYPVAAARMCEWLSPQEHLALRQFVLSK